MDTSSQHAGGLVGAHLPEHLPIAAAATMVVVAQSPVTAVDLLADLDTLLENGLPGPAREAIGSATWWLIAVAREPPPYGLPVFVRDSSTGRISPVAYEHVYWASAHADGVERVDPSEGWPGLEVLVAAARRAQPEIEISAPALQICVSHTALAPRLAPAFAMFTHARWQQLGTLVEHLEHAPTRLRTILDLPIATLRDAHQAYGAYVEETSRAQAAEELAAARPIVSTKSLVARHEGDFRRRWAAKEWETAAAARRALALALNTREDGTVARRSDEDHHSEGTIERLTRGWFGS